MIEIIVSYKIEKKIQISNGVKQRLQRSRRYDNTLPENKFQIYGLGSWSYSFNPMTDGVLMIVGPSARVKLKLKLNYSDF